MLSKKYFSKLFTRLIQFSSSLLLLGIVPRALGPIGLGIYEFLNSFFGNLSRLANLETSNAYFSKLSKRQNETSLISYIVIFNFLGFVITFLLMCIIIVLGLKEKLIGDIKLTFIFCSIVFTFLLSYVGIIRLTHDALGYTIKIEKVFSFQAVLSFFLLFIFYKYDFLTLELYFTIQIFNQLIIIIPGFYILLKNSEFKINNLLLSKDKIVKYSKEFYQFCHPLVFYAFVVFFVGISDRLLLLKFGGLKEQGLYGFSAKISDLIFIIPSAMSVLIFRELSISVSQNKKNRIRVILTKNLYLFYFIASYFAIFISQNAEYVTHLIGGDKFLDASPVLAIISFYPLHQIYGQFLGSLLISYEKTSILRNVGSLVIVFGLVLSIFLIGPDAYNCLQLGAVGYAYKMIIYQIILSNVFLIIVSKLIRLKLRKIIFHQIYVVGVLYIIMKISELILQNKFSNVNLAFFLSGVLYSLLCAILIFTFPRIIGLNRNKLVGSLRLIKWRN